VSRKPAQPPEALAGFRRGLSVSAPYDSSVCRDLHLEPDRLLFAELRTLVQEWADQNA